MEKGKIITCWMHHRKIKNVNLCKNNCIVYDSLYMLIKILLFKTKKNEFYPYNDYQI